MNDFVLTTSTGKLILSGKRFTLRTALSFYGSLFALSINFVLIIYIKCFLSPIFKNRVSYYNEQLVSTSFSDVGHRGY